MIRNNMGRRMFLGTAAAGVGAAAMGLGGTARAIGGDEPWDKKVYPTGDPRLDRANIVTALLNPRNKTITLMSTTAPGANAMKMEFDLTGQSTIEITRSVTIIGQNAKIFFNGVVFSASPGCKVSMRNISFFNVAQPGESLSPISVTRPRDGSVTIDLNNVAIGGDEPWD